MASKRGNNEGSIYRRADGRWTASVTLPGGKRKSYYGKTRQEVARKLAATLRDLEKGVLPSSDKWTVQVFIDRWLKDVVTPSVRPRTVGSYKWAARHIVGHLGNQRLANLSPAQIQAMLRVLSDQLGPQSVKHVHTVLKTALGVAVTWGILAQNPAERVKAPHVPRVQRAVLDAIQARQFLESIRDDRFEAVYQLALGTGMRLGEVLGLRWQDCDLERGVVRVQVQLAYRTSDWQLVEPKSARSQRTLAISPRVVQALRARRTRQIEERLAAGEIWKDYDLVFTTAVGTPVSPGNMTRRYFKAALANAGLPALPFHALRRSVVTMLSKQGLHPEIVRDLLGHSTTALTMEVYNQMQPGSGQVASRELIRLFGD